jgi:hypothetical protein
MSQLRQSAVRNHLLASLPPDDFAALGGSLRPLDLVLRQTLHAPDRPIETVYFPESGMVSMVAALEDGQLMEVGIVGREGMVGLPVVITYRHGHLAVLDRPGLEGTSCECYGAVRRRFERLLGVLVGE